MANPPVIGLSELFPSASERQYKVGELLSSTKESEEGPGTTAPTTPAPPDRPKPKMKPSKSERKSTAGGRAQQPVAVDLKAELRSESVKAFSSSPVTATEIAGKGGGETARGINGDGVVLAGTEDAAAQVLCAALPFCSVITYCKGAVSSPILAYHPYPGLFVAHSKLWKCTVQYWGLKVCFIRFSDP